MNSTERCGRTPLLSIAAVKWPARSPVINYMALDLYKHCAPGGIRTPNLLIRSQMLYPLSYGRLLSCVRTEVRFTAPSPEARHHTSGTRRGGSHRFHHAPANRCAARKRRDLNPRCP